MGGDEKRRVTAEHEGKASSEGAAKSITLEVTKLGWETLAIWLQVRKRGVSASDEGSEHVAKALDSYNCS